MSPAALSPTPLGAAPASPAPLVAVAHGSRDPRSAQTINELAAAVRARAPDLEVRAAFLDLSAPSLSHALGELHRAGHREVVLVPLLLGSAFHARVDLPALVEGARTALPMLRITVAEVLGPDPELEAAAQDRLAEAGAPVSEPGLGVALAGVGSAHPPANEAVARLAGSWNEARPATVAPAFATTEPGLGSALARLRAAGAHRLAVAPWFLAPGLLLDRLHRIAAESAGPLEAPVVAGPLACHPRVADLVLRRYHHARDAVHRAA